MKLGIRVVLGVLLLLWLPVKALAVPVVDGYWDSSNSDGYTLYDINYTDLAAGGGVDMGVLGIAVSGNDLYIMLAQPNDVNDNTFGTTASAGWGAMGHSLDDLLGSDHMVLTIGSTTNPIWQASIDYASDLTTIAAGSSGPTPPGPPGPPAPGAAGDMVGAVTDTYGSAGDSGGDGAAPTGTSVTSGNGASALIAAQTSLGWDLNPANTSAACVDTAIGTDATMGGNSPATTNENVTGPCNWLYTNVYEVELNMTDLGLAGDSVSQIASLLGVTTSDTNIEVHNSPTEGVDTVLCDSTQFSTGAPCAGGGAVPEPASLVLLGSGVIGVGALIRRRKVAPRA